MSINCNLTILCNSDLPDFTLMQLQSASVAELVVFYFLIGILWIQIEIMFVTGVNVTSEFFVDCNLAAFSFCIIRKARSYGSNHGNPKASCKLFKLLHRYDNYHSLRTVNLSLNGGYWPRTHFDCSWTVLESGHSGDGSVICRPIKLKVQS